MATAVLFALVGGTVLGLLGKLVAPGDRDAVPLWLTILAGIGGALLGSWLHGRFLNPAAGGVDWVHHGWQTVAGALLVLLVAALTGQRRTA